MFVRIGMKFERWARKYIPDPLVIAMILTILLGLMAIVCTESSIATVADSWMTGFWEFLAFSMQVAFGLIAGAALCQAPIVKKGMARICSIPKNSRQAAVFLFCSVLVIDWVNWGLGIIAGAFLAKEIATQFAKKGVPHHLPCLAAAAHGGTIVYGLGWTGAIPLMVSTPTHFAVEQMGQVPLVESLLGKLNLIVLLGILVFGALTFYALHPKDESKFIMLQLDGNDQTESSAPTGSVLTQKRTFAERVENITIWSYGLAIFWAIWIVRTLMTKGFEAIDLNMANVTLLILGLLAWKYPLRYVSSFKAETSQASSIILQFHFYAGIMGIMKYTGLVSIISNLFVNIATAETFPLLAYLSAGLVNFAIPSGGGQWAVQGPVMIDAASKLGANMLHVTMAVSYGDSWTNMITPFWALPMAGVLGIKVRDFLGYTIALALVVGLWTSAVLLLFGYGIL